MIRKLLVLLACSPCFAEAGPFDHVAAIKGLRDGDARKGRELYALHCASCHGTDGKLSLNPLARRFALDEFKFGADPYSIWKTISYGNGLMFRWDVVLSEEERYQIVHHIREDIIRPNNPAQYSQPVDEYYAALNARAAEDADEQAANSQKVEVAPGMIDGTGGTRMNYGPFLQHAVALGEIPDQNAPNLPDTTEKALIIDLPDSDAVICYDAARLSVSGIWRGSIADTSKTHHTSYKGSLPLRPGGEVYFQELDKMGWQGGEIRFHGHYLHGDRVVLSYSVGDRDILETPMALKKDPFVGRSLQVGPGDDAIRCLVSREHMHWLEFAASKWPSKGIINLAEAGDAAEADFTTLTKGGPRRWPVTVQTAVAPGENIEGYALDALTVPLANPYGSWMRTTALDFFSDGRMAVSTLSGDVWIVSWTVDNPNALTWSRYAAGLYEPLGLRIVDDKVYVRGRDRITRLHDLNNDGEADYYESFHEDRNEIGASYHAFSYDLQVDRDGYFYYAQGGYKSPLDGAVMRVSPDGRSSEVIGGDLRNPNGLGAGGPQGWVTVADNPSGNSIYNGFTITRAGALHGFEKPRNLPMLVVLPAHADSSSGSQCWSDPKWGPLGGSIVHTSYSRCSAFYCFTQDLEPFPNGFAVQFPFELKSAPMRTQVNPADGQVYIACQKGWDTKAPVDGVIYRLRATGKTCHLVTGAEATKSGIRLSFGSDLDPASIRTNNIHLARESDAKNAEVRFEPAAAVKRIDPRTIEIAIAGIDRETLEHRTDRDAKTGAVTVKVSPAYSIELKLRAADGTAVEQTVFATINSLP